MTDQPTNPFPGLRPFEEDEEPLFFGREQVIIDLLSRLRTSRFLAVTGTSGCGKSSLVKAGLLPALHRGFMAGAGSSWRVALFRPGCDPIGNLAESLTRARLFKDTTPDAMQRRIIESTLRRSNHGLIEVVREARLPGYENFLIVVDQFEELFRFEKLEKSLHKEIHDSTAFVDLLMAVPGQTGMSLYIILTMRSDFLGDCTIFQGLPEAINSGQYLVPRMTREEKREAITSPIGIGGAYITPMLVSRLLNDVGDNPDQLPILQHALMRTWNYWSRDRRQDEPLGLRHYEAIGAMEHALSQHAEEAYLELKTPHSRTICEKMFKFLIEIGERGSIVRRPARVDDLCQVTGASPKQVIDVINHFRRPGRTFLMPPGHVPLHPGSDIDISHESLIRIWTRLNRWVKKEEHSAEFYLRLAKAAALHREGKVGLWRDPELILALEWLEEQEPNAVWARRYHTGFDQAINFLEASKKQKQYEVAQKEREQRAKIRRATLFSIIIAIVAIIAIIFAFMAIKKGQEARKMQEEAWEQKLRAEEARDDAREERKKAEISRKQAEEAREKESQERIKAEKNEKEANEERARAQENEKKARQAEALARENQVKEQIKGLIADMNREEASFRGLLAKARELAAHSRTQAGEETKELRTKLALAAFRLNEDAYGALDKNTREVLEKFDKDKLDEFAGQTGIGNLFNELEKLRDKLKKVSSGIHCPAELFETLRDAYIDVEEKGDIIYQDVESWAMAAPGGSIVFSDRENNLFQAALQPSPGRARLPVLKKNRLLSPISTFQATCLAESSECFFCGTDDGRILYWEKSSWRETRQLRHRGAKILAMAASWDNRHLFYSVKNKLYICDLISKKSFDRIFPLEKHNYILTMSVIEGPGAGDSFLIAGDENGVLHQVSIYGGRWEKKIANTAPPAAHQSALHSSALDPRRKRLVMGDSSGRIHFFYQVDGGSLSPGVPINRALFEYAHEGIVSVLAFSPGGRYLASGGLDGAIMLWDLDGLNNAAIARQKPIIHITGNRKILSLVFAPNGEYLVFNDEKNLRICPTRPEIFYDLLCRKKKWAFTPGEWRRYFGEALSPEQMNFCPARREN
jgi:hypothetical protein